MRITPLGPAGVRLSPEVSTMHWLFCTRPVLGFKGIEVLMSSPCSTNFWTCQSNSIMQVLFTCAANPFFSQRPTNPISFRPLANVYCARKTCLVPLAGRVGFSRLATTEPSTVHVPRCAPADTARFESMDMYTFFAPAKVGRKRTASVTVSTVWVVPPLDATRSTMHWLFWSTPPPRVPVAPVGRPLSSSSSMFSR